MEDEEHTGMIGITGMMHLVPRENDRVAIRCRPLDLDVQLLLSVSTKRVIRTLRRHVLNGIALLLKMLCGSLHRTEL
jgi:hypothetical protein